MADVTCSIDEAVETTKVFCGAEAPAFVNGILGKIASESSTKSLGLTTQTAALRGALEQAALALLVDAGVPKERILEIYVNVIEFGPGLYGIGPAAQHYFGKRARDCVCHPRPGHL